MAFKIPSGAVRRMDLPGVVVENGENFGRFQAMNILPPFEVTANAGTITKMIAKNFVKDVDTARPRGAKYKEIGAEVSSDTYLVKEHAVKQSVDDEVGEELGSMDHAVDNGAVAVNLTLARRYEKEVAALIYNETTFPASGNTGLTVSNAWNVAAGTPITDVNTGKDKMLARCPHAPNTLIIHESRVRRLFKSTEWAAQFKGALRDMMGNPTDEMLRTAFDIEKVIVVGAKYDSGNEAAAMSLSDIWSPAYAGLCAWCGMCSWEAGKAQVIAGTCPNGWAPDEHGLVWWEGILHRGVPWLVRVRLAVKRRRWSLVKALPGCGCIDRLKGWTEAFAAWWDRVTVETGEAEACRVAGEW